MNRLVPLLLLSWIPAALGQAQPAMPQPVASPLAPPSAEAAPAGRPEPRPLNDPLLTRRGSWGQREPDQWGLYQIGLVREDGAPTAAFSAPLEPVTVALIDSGVDYRHPDLPVGKLWRNPDEQANGRDDDGNGLIDDLIGWNFVDGNNSPWDDHGHGTHLAGVIAADRNNGLGIAGIAPNARLMVLKVVDTSGHANASHIARAIRYAVDKGARLIHLSLGGQPPGEVERDALREALDRGVLVVTAAGNQARGDQPGYGRLPGVLVVGATTPAGERALFSDWGSDLDLLAPGVEILSLRAEGSDFLRRNGLPDYAPGSAVVERDYYRATGTSFAAPHVTAVAALMLGQDPLLKPPQLQRKLLQSARDLGPPGVDQNHGYGLLDAPGALEAAPGHFVEAWLERAELDTNRRLRVLGTADADQFQRARIELRLKEHPERWRELITLTQPVRHQPLLILDLDLLPKSQRSTVLRLITEHRDGSRRESRLQLELPGVAP